MLTEYIKNNSDILNRTNKEINSSFFKNINNVDLNKKNKLKFLILYLNNIIIQKNLKNIFIKWKYFMKEYNQEKNQNNIIINFFDSCLSLNINNNEIIYNNDNNNNTNTNISNNNLNKNDNSINNNSNQNENAKNINGIREDNKNMTFKEKKTPKRNDDFCEYNYPEYNDINNASIDVKKSSNNEHDKNNDNIINDNNDNVDNIDIIDDFDIKINEEIIIDSKENSKFKSDIFDNELIDSLNEKKIIDNNTLNISTKKDIDDIIIKEKVNKIDNYLDNNSKVENNEICNLFHNEKDSLNNSLNNISNENNNYNNQKIIKNEIINEINNNNIIYKEKNKLIKDLNIIKNNSSKKNKNDNSLNNSEQNINSSSIIDNNDNSKNNLFDSLEDINYETNNGDNYLNINYNKEKTKNNIQENKIKILNQFLTLDKDKDKDKIKDIKSKNFVTPKKYLFQVSETNNIFLNKNNNIINKDNKIDSFNYINQTKTENIFIKGVKNKGQYNSENKTKKKLELFVVDKNDDIFIKHNTNKNQKIKNDFNYLKDNDFIKNNIQERLIDSKMIFNFLNNSKNEPMFPSKKSINQNSNIKQEINKNIINNNKINKDSIQILPQLDKYINLNINNIIHFSINNKNENKNINSNNIKNFSGDKNNFFYLKKQKLNYKYDNKNTKKTIRNNLNNLNIDELELIEPNVQICQICPISNSKSNNSKEKIKDMHEKLSNGNIVEDLLKIKKRKKIYKNNKKLSKNSSSDLISIKIIDKYTSREQNGKNTRNKNNSISNDLIDFINSAKNNNKENKNRNCSFNRGDIYNFNTVKYDKYNTYRENLNKNNLTKKRNSQNNIIVDSFKNIDISKNDSNKTIKNKNKNNSSFVNNKKRNVDYKRLNELYLDYKIKNIKRNQLKKEQDLKSGITFIPHTNKCKINKID